VYVAVGEAMAARGLFTKAAWRAAIKAHEKRQKDAA
jgi:hypothetical protein